MTRTQRWSWPPPARGGSHLLAQIGIVPDRVDPPTSTKPRCRDELPRQHALRLARAKADAVGRARLLTCWPPTPWSPPGGASCPRRRPRRRRARCLTLLSGRRHRVLTAVVLRAPDGRRGERLVESVVGFARLTERQIDAYLASGEWQRQGRRLRHPGPRRGVRPLPVGQLFQRGRPAAVRDGAACCAGSAGRCRDGCASWPRPAPARSASPCCAMTRCWTTRSGGPARRTASATAPRPGHRARAGDGGRLRGAGRRRGVPARQRGWRGSA